MALSKAVLEMLGTITDENDRKEIQAKFEKYETVIQGRFEGNLRQQDYDRQMNAEKDAKKALEDTAKKWQEWADRNVPKHENLLKSMEEEKKVRTQLEEEVAKLKASTTTNNNGENKIDEAELLKKANAELDKRGYVSKTELAEIVKAEAMKLADEKTKEISEKTLPAWATFNAQITDLQFKHRDEFGKALDRKAFIEFMAKEKLDDPDKAYNQYIAEDRKKQEMDKMRAEIEKDVRSKMNVPGTGAAPTPEMGAVAMMLNKAKGGKVDELPAELSANAAAAELRAEGKF